MCLECIFGGKNKWKIPNIHSSNTYWFKNKMDISKTRYKKDLVKSVNYIRDVLRDESYSWVSTLYGWWKMLTEILFLRERERAI